MASPIESSTHFNNAASDASPEKKNQLLLLVIKGALE